MVNFVKGIVVMVVYGNTHNEVTIAEKNIDVEVTIPVNINVKVGDYVSLCIANNIITWIYINGGAVVALLPYKTNWVRNAVNGYYESVEHICRNKNGKIASIILDALGDHLAEYSYDTNSAVYCGANKTVEFDFVSNEVKIDNEWYNLDAVFVDDNGLYIRDEEEPDLC